METSYNIKMIDGATVKYLLNYEEAKDVIRNTYLLHEDGETVLPHSVFLKPDQKNRIIGLPAAIAGNVRVSGIKWVSSYCDNHLAGKPRASSMIILNDAQTGYPFCCVNGTYINLFRTACSAFLVAEKLLKQRSAVKLGIIGTGAIAGCFIECLRRFGTIRTDHIVLYDSNPGQVQTFIRNNDLEQFSIAQSVEELIGNCVAVLLATTAATPYIFDPTLFFPQQLILNISLRDLGAEVILAADNIVDDPLHVNRENTSVNLAFKKTGNLDFIAGNIARLLRDEIILKGDKPVIFSPFGLGILDLATGKYIFDKAAQQNIGTVINNF